MEPDKDKDITRLMAEALRKQKLPYREGAWERFKEMEAERKSKRTLWPYLSAVAAAAVLVIGVLISTSQENLSPSGDIVQTSVAIPEAVDTDAPEAGSTDDPQAEEVDASQGTGSTGSRIPQYLAYNAPSQPSAFAERADHEGNQAERPEAPEAKPDPSTSVPSAEKSPSAAQSPSEPYAAAQPAQKNALNESVISNNSYDAMVKKEPEPVLGSAKDSRWSFSLELSPNIKNKEVNMGGGVGVSYALTDRLSVSSGVSYVALDAQRGPSQQDIPQEFSNTSLSKYNYNKSLSNINTSLVGLDIPLNVRFQVNPKMYASAGVSVFNVLEESRYNQFEEHVAVLGSTSTKDNSGNPEPVIQTLRTQELSGETPYQGKNFTGFFNLSVGYQLPVLKKLNLAVEPYIKVPIGSLSEQDMDLSNGGLKIITTF